MVTVTVERMHLLLNIRHENAFERIQNLLDIYRKYFYELITHFHVRKVRQHMISNLPAKAFRKAQNCVFLAMVFILNPETPIQKSLCTPMFIAVLFTIAKCWKQPKCSLVNEWIKKLWYIYMMEYYTAERKKELLPFAIAWMDWRALCSVI